MQQSRPDRSSRPSADEPAFQNYLPGMPRVSSEPGRVERFLKRLFRQRGTYRVRLRRE